LKQFWKILQT